MSYGPVRMDFTPLGQIGSSFFNARDQAIDRQFKMAQLTAPSEIASIMAQNSGQGGATPPANAQPGMVPLGSIGQGKAPSFAAMQGTQPSADYGAMFSDEERKYALPAGYLSRTAAIESRFNPNAQNPNSSAGGMFQFTDGTAKQYGLSNKYDPAASTDAAARLASDNRNVLTKVLGREPTAGELYLAHQQGAGGAAKLLANPNARAVDVVGADAVRLNGGDPNMTAGQFATLWTRKVDGQGGNPADEPAPGAQNAQFVIPGSGQAVPAQSQAPYQVTAPQIPVPPYIKALAASANPYVKAEATKLYLQYQQQQQNYALEAWKMNQNQGFELRKQQADQAFQQPYRQGTMEAQQARAAAAQSQADTANRRLDYDMNGKPILTGPDQTMRKPDGTVIASPQSYKDLITPEDRAAAGIDPTYQGPVQRKPNNELVFPGKAGVNVSNVVGGGGKIEELTAKKFDQAMSLDQEASKRAAIYGQMLKAAEGFDPGASAEGRLNAQKLFESITGTKFDSTKSGEALQLLGRRLELAMAQSSMKGEGSVTENERYLVRQAIPAMTNTPDGLKTVIALSKRLDDYDRAVAKVYRDNLRANKGNINTADLYDQIAQLGPALTPEETQALQSVTGNKTDGGETTPAPAPAPTATKPPPAPKKLGDVPIPPTAVKYLQANPNLRAAFDEKYGVGAADRILGKQK